MVIFQAYFLIPFLLLYSYFLCVASKSKSKKVTFQSKIQNPFPSPKYPKHRTAVILSGQWRVANYTILSSHVRAYRHRANITDYFGTNDPLTTVQTQLEHFIRPYAEYGGVDLFIYIQSLPGMMMNESWDGRAETYEASPGDFRPCELYSSSPIFARHTTNKVFCLIEPPHILSDHFIRKFPIWKTFLSGYGPEAFLQQLYGMYRGNLAVKEYSKMQDFYYRYKVRIRPDMAFIKPMPLPDAIQPLPNPERTCVGPTVFSPAERVFGISAADSFNIGESQYMDFILDRYMHILVDHYHPKLCKTGDSPITQWWSECHNGNYLEDLYHVCLRQSEDILMMKIQKNDHEYHVPFHTFRHMDWVDLTPD